MAKEQTCPKCAGTGVLSVTLGKHTGTVTCAACDGEGTIKLWWLDGEET